MKTIEFSNKLVNVSKIGYLSTRWGTGVYRGETAVVMLVDGVELKEWYKTFTEAQGRYERLQKILGVAKYK